MLQEVAAARNILIKCGSTEIGGFAFCVGLTSRSFEPIYKVFPGLQSLIRTAIYLIRGAEFRAKMIPDSPNEFSLRIRPLGELIEMYHTRKATMRHDKIFALLGMSSDNPIAGGLSPDYETPWESLLEKLVRYLLGNHIAVKGCTIAESAVIQGKGCLLGKISSVGDPDRNGILEVIMVSKDAFGYLGPERKQALQASAKSILVGDLVCLLHGAKKPTIIRPCKGHFEGIMIAAPLKFEYPVSIFPHNILLVWDWSTQRIHGQEEDGNLIERRAPTQLATEREGSSNDMDTLWNVVLVLEEAEEYNIAEMKLQEALGVYEREFGEKHAHTSKFQAKIALIQKKMKQQEEAKSWSKQPENFGGLRFSQSAKRHEWIVGLSFERQGLFRC